jgi:uncharacterized membrane protein
MLVLLLSGCSHTINYKLTEEDRWTGPKINHVLYVQPFLDRSIPRTNEWEIIGHEHWRSNLRSRYKNKNLGEGVSAMIAKHLAYSGLFASVVYRTPTNGDWALSGTLSDYSTLGRINGTAEGIEGGTLGFGLIGAIIGTTATAGMKTEIRVSIKVDDMALVNQAGETLWRNSINTEKNFAAHFSESEQAVIYHHPDDSLKQVVAGLIRTWGNSSLTNRTITLSREN